MPHQHHTFDSLPSLHEHRLAYAAPPVEVLPKNMRENPEALRAYLTLEDIAAEIDPKTAAHEEERQRRLEQALSYLKNDTEELGDRFVVGTTTVDLLARQQEALEEKIRDEADASLRILFERTKDHIAARQAEVQDLVDDLRKRIDDAKDRPESIAIPGGTMGHVLAQVGGDAKKETVKETSGRWADAIAEKIPGVRGLPKETKRNLMLGISLGMIVVGAALWLHGRKSLEKGRTARATGGILAGIGAGLLAFSGIDEIREWLGNAKKVKEMVEEGKEKVDEMVDEARHAIDEVRDRLSGATGEELERLRQKEHELEILLEKAQRGEALSDEQKESIQRGAEFLAVSLAQKSLPFQYDVMREIDKDLDTPTPYLRDANEILSLAARKSVPMGYFFDCMDAGFHNRDSYISLLRVVFDAHDFNQFSAEELNHQIIAVKLVIGFLSKYRNVIEDSVHYSEYENVRDMPLQEALNIFVRLPGASLELAGRMSENVGSMIQHVILEQKLPNPTEAVEALREAFDNPELIGDQMVMYVLSPLSRYSDSAPATKEEKEKFQEAVTRVALLFTNRNVRIRNIESVIPSDWSKEGVEREIAINLCERIRNNPNVRRRILAAAFVPDDPEQRNRYDQRVHDALSRILDEGNISLADAFQIHYLLESNEGGGMVLVFKVIDLLRKNHEKELAIDRYNTVGDRLIDVAAGSAESLSELAMELGLKDKEIRAISNLGLYLREQSWRKFEDACLSLKSFVEHHTIVAGGLGLLTLAPPIAYLYNKTIWHRIRGFAGWDDTQIITFASKYKVSPGEVKRAVQEAKVIMNDVKELSFGWNRPLKGWSLRNEARRWKKSAKKPGGVSQRVASGKSRVAAIVDDVIPPPVQTRPRVAPHTTPTPPSNTSSSASHTGPKPPPPPPRQVTPPPRPRGVGPEAFDGTGARQLDAVSDAVPETGPQLRIVNQVGDVIYPNTAGRVVDAVLDNLDDAARIVGHLDDGTPIYFAKLLEAASGNDDAMRALSRLSDANIRTVVAAEAGDAAKAVSKLGIIGKAARVLSGVAIAGDVFAIAFAGYEAYHTSQLIAATPEGKLRDEYAERYYYHGATAAVGGVGFVAGVVGIAAAGTTAGAIAVPVALATLPVSMTIGALYQRHKFHEDLARGVEDWKREADPHHNLANMRTLGFGEALGQQTDIVLKDGNWIFYSLNTGMPLLDAVFVRAKNKIILWKTQGTRERQQEEIDVQYHNMIQAIVEESNVMQVPITVRDPETREERTLTPDEQKYYEGCRVAYEEAKAEYLWENGQEILFHGGANQAALGFLLKDAEAYARLQQDRYALEHIHMIIFDTSKIPAVHMEFPDASLSTKEQAYEYQVMTDKQALAGMLAIAQAAIAEGNEHAGKQLITMRIAPILEQRVAPHMLAFRTKVEETDFTEWHEVHRLWVDGNRSKLTELHVLNLVQDILDREAGKVAASILNTARSAGRVSGEDMIEGLWSNLATADMMLSSYLQNPKARWQELKDDKERFMLVQKHLKMHLEIEEARMHIEPLRQKVAEYSVPQQSQFSYTNAHRLQRRKKEELERYERILTENPEWLKRNPL